MSLRKLKPFAVKLSGKQKFKRLLGSSRSCPEAKEGLRSGLVVLKPKSSVGLHSTEKRQEIIVILEGRARVYYGRKGKFELEENSFVYLPPETMHNVENAGSSLLKYLYITATEKRYP